MDILQEAKKIYKMYPLSDLVDDLQVYKNQLEILKNTKDRFLVFSQGDPVGEFSFNNKYWEKLKNLLIDNTKHEIDMIKAIIREHLEEELENVK